MIQKKVNFNNYDIAVLLKNNILLNQFKGGEFKNYFHYFFIKDCSVTFLLSQRPQLKSFLDSISLIMEMKKSQYKYVTFDYQEIFADHTIKSCKNLNWHTDGEDNEYLLIVWGNKRTEFKELPCLEVDDGVLYQYDSSDVHRGRILEAGEKRVFLRVCFSNVIKPNNKVMFNLK